MTRRLAVLAAVAAFTGAAGGTARGALVAQLGGGSNAVFLARLMPLFRASSAGGSFEIPFFRLSRHLHQTATLQKVVRANKRRRDLGARNRGNHAENSSKTQARKSATVEVSSTDATFSGEFCWRKLRNPVFQAFSTPPPDGDPPKSRPSEQEAPRSRRPKPRQPRRKQQQDPGPKIGTSRG